MTRSRFIALAIGLSHGCLASAPDAMAQEDAPNAGSSTVSAAPAPSGWQIGLRAGWGLSSHAQGDLDSQLFIPDGGPQLSAQSGFSKSVHETDLAIDVLMPWSFGIARPFATFGGGIAMGDNEKTGGVTSFPTSGFSGGGPTPPGFPDTIEGLTTASLKDVANFYTRVGGDLAFPMPGAGSTASFHVRPYAGFDVRAYQGTLGIHPSVLEPFVGSLGIPDQNEKSSFTRVSPLAGAEFVVPLCAHDCWGVAVYFGAEYQFDVGGKDNLFRNVDGANAYASVSGGNVFRGFAGIQYHFRLGGN